MSTPEKKQQRRGSAAADEPPPTAREPALGNEWDAQQRPQGFVSPQDSDGTNRGGEMRPTWWCGPGYYGFVGAPSLQGAPAPAHSRLRALELLETPAAAAAAAARGVLAASDAAVLGPFDTPSECWVAVTDGALPSVAADDDESAELHIAELGATSCACEVELEGRAAAPFWVDAKGVRTTTFALAATCKRCLARHSDRLNAERELRLEDLAEVGAQVDPYRCELAAPNLRTSRKMTLRPSRGLLLAATHVQIREQAETQSWGRAGGEDDLGTYLVLQLEQHFDRAIRLVRLRDRNAPEAYRAGVRAALEGGPAPKGRLAAQGYRDASAVTEELQELRAAVPGASTRPS